MFYKSVADWIDFHINHHIKSLLKHNVFTVALTLGAFVCFSVSMPPSYFFFAFLTLLTNSPTFVHNRTCAWLCIYMCTSLCVCVCSLYSSCSTAVRPCCGSLTCSRWWRRRRGGGWRSSAGKQRRPSGCSFHRYTHSWCPHTQTNKQNKIM